MRGRMKRKREALCTVECRHYSSFLSVWYECTHILIVHLSLNAVGRPNFEWFLTCVLLINWTLFQIYLFFKYNEILLVLLCLNVVLQRQTFVPIWISCKSMCSNLYSNGIRTKVSILCNFIAHSRKKFSSNLRMTNGIRMLIYCSERRNMMQLEYNESMLQEFVT